MVKLLLQYLGKVWPKGVILVNQGSIKAVHDDDLETFLDSLGVLKKVRDGRMKCNVCGSIVTLDNFQCAYPYDGKINLCCSNSGCYEKILSWGKIANG